MSGFVERLREAERVTSEAPVEADCCGRLTRTLRAVEYADGTHLFCEKCYYNAEVAYGLRPAPPSGVKKRSRK